MSKSQQSQNHCVAIRCFYDIALIAWTQSTPRMSQVDHDVCIRGSQGSRGRWISATEGTILVVGGEPFWRCTDADATKVVPLVQHDLSGPRERPIWMHSNGDMYLGGWKKVWGSFVEDGFGVTYYGEPTIRHGMIHIGCWQFGKLQGLGKETWLASSMEWRENNFSLSCITEETENGGAVGRPYSYKGHFENGCKQDSNAVVTLKDGTSRKGKWAQEAVGNWWNDHAPVNGHGKLVTTSCLVDASDVSIPAKESAVVRGKRPACKSKSPSNKRARPRASCTKNHARQKRSASRITSLRLDDLPDAWLKRWTLKLRRKGSTTSLISDCGKRDGWSFIPSSLLPRQATRNHQEFLDAKNRVFQHGIEAVIGYEGLKEMIEQYGEDYAPTMPELSAHQVSICRAAVSQATNEGSEEQEGIEDPSPTAGGADSVDESHSCPNHAHVQEFRGSSVAKASPGSATGVPFLHVLPTDPEVLV